MKSKPGHKIGIYIRVSTEEQAQNPEGSIKSQEQRLRQHITYKNLEGTFGDVTQVFIDRAKPDNSVRINPATRHSETKYGFVILTGDMIFKDFFVGVKLLLRHEHLSSAAANSRQNQLTCYVSKTRLRGG